VAAMASAEASRRSWCFCATAPHATLIVILKGLIELVLWSCLGHHPRVPGDASRVPVARRGVRHAAAGTPGAQNNVVPQTAGSYSLGAGATWSFGVFSCLSALRTSPL